MSILALGRNRIDHTPDTGYNGRWKPAALRMLGNECVVIGEIYAKRLVTRYIRMFPLNLFLFGLHFGENAI